MGIPKRAAAQAICFGFRLGSIFQCLHIGEAVGLLGKVAAHDGWRVIENDDAVFFALFDFEMH